MKNSMFFSTLIVFVLLISFSCDKNFLEQPLEKCSLNGNLISVEDKIGELIYTDSIPGLKFSQKEYFISNYGIDSIYLSLKPCNLPDQYKITSLSSNVSIKFSGNIQLLPSTVDAASLNLEFSKIELNEN